MNRDKSRKSFERACRVIPGGVNSPARAFGENNNADEARRRQVACIEWCDKVLEPLLARFANDTIIACADHGDCWGEDGLWEHGISHEKTLEVPLLFRLAADAFD